jgi:hypothetical protein
MFETIQAIQRGAIFDRSQFTRRALKELRQRAAQDDGVACYWLGLYYLGPLKTGRSKALAFFTKALSVAQATGNMELEADVRRKLLVIQIRNFFKRYIIPTNKANFLFESVHKEMALIANLYRQETIYEGMVALACDYEEAALPIHYALLGVARMGKRETENVGLAEIPSEACGIIAKNNPDLVKRLCYLGTMLKKVIKIDQAIGAYPDEQCKKCSCKKCPL